MCCGVAPPGEGERAVRSRRADGVRLQTVRDTCFDKCITKPSSSMSSGEVTCLARCCDRYLEVRGRCFLRSGVALA